MKVGVLTVYFADYGSYYHAISLRTAIEKLGYECELINATIRYPYSPKLLAGYIGAKYFPKFIINAISKKVTTFNTYIILQDELKSEKVSEKSFSIKKLSKKYDCIVVGSDELWSVTNNNIGFVPAYFGIGIECPHISYATSAATLKSPSRKIKEKMSDGFKTFDFLSARDEFTCNIVKEYSGKECVQVIDPTLLNPFFGSDGEGGGGYILVYGEHFNYDQISAIKEYANIKGWSLKSVAWKHDWCDEFINVRSAKELQRAFSKSEYCMSSTFHGTIFSILNQRQFTSFITSKRGPKVKYLLEQLDLKSRIFAPNDKECMNNGIDYKEVNALLKLQREDSYKYLKNSLKQIEKNTK